MHDGDLEETHTSMDNDQFDDDQKNKVYEENMKDFVPEDFITFELNEGQSFMLLEQVHHLNENRVIKGSYSVLGGTPD